MESRSSADTRHTLGKRAEDVALRWLCRRGLSLVARNVRCRHGEIDLVMLDGDILVFIEVRCRSRRSLARASLTVTNSKQRRLVAAASHFLATRTAMAQRTVRFDVIGYDAAPSIRTDPEWIKDAFRPPP